MFIRPNPGACFNIMNSLDIHIPDPAGLSYYYYLAAEKPSVFYKNRRIRRLEKDNNGLHAW